MVSYLVLVTLTRNFQLTFECCQVGEKWYPDLLAKIREEQRLEAEQNHDPLPNGQAIGVR